jgi:mono/diheme cytochrome c family protein
MVPAGLRASEQAPAVASHAIAARPLTDRRFERTPARLERGRYLVEGPAHCFMCHSENDWSPLAKGQPLPGLKGGGRVWADYGLPWLFSPNISPDPETGAGTWTDDMLARAIREGVGHDGRALFFMPWEAFRSFSDEDLASVVVYLRSIPPVRRALPKAALPEPIRATLKPEPLTAPVPARDLSSPVKRGEYLVEIGQCAGCHSAYDRNENPIPGMKFGGGLPLRGGWGDVTAPNLTQDPSGIPYYTEDLFIQTIRTGKVVARELNPVMPRSYFKNMTDEDLKAIFAYLKTLPPVKHRVSNVDPPTACKLCGGTHGLGDQN